MDETDRRIVNALQGGLPLCSRPYAAAATALGLEEAELLRRIDKLLGEKILSRFGPMFDAERLGGAFTLCAMRVPAEDFERVAALVNAHAEVAHNYAREHELNMWFVLATGSRERTAEVLRAIEQETGYPVLDLPKEAEYFVGMRLAA